MPGPDDKRTLGQLGADLARKWATQRLTAVQSYGRILSDYGAGRTSSTAAAGAYARLAAEETVRYSADAIGLATDLAAALVRKAGGRLETAARTVQPVQDLELSGPVGGKAAATFVLHNPHDRAASLSFVAGHFAGPSGDTKATVTVEPPQFELAPGAEQAVKVSALLDPAVFEPGGRYTANVAVAGFEDLVLRVRLSVMPA